MSKRINLPRGKYWFYGYPDISKIEEFKKFLDEICGGCSNSIKKGYVYQTGDETDLNGVCGVFLGNVGDNGYVYEINWISKNFSPRQFNDVVTQYPRLSMYSVPENNYLIDVNKKIDNSKKVVLEFSPGVTKCDETCIFWMICDGERESNLNPSQLLLNCNQYILNRGKYEKSRE